MKRFIVYLLIVIGIIVGSIEIGNLYCVSAIMRCMVTVGLASTGILVTSIVAYILETRISIRKL